VRGMRASRMPLSSFTPPSPPLPLPPPCAPYILVASNPLSHTISLSLSLPLNSPQAAGLDAAFDGLADALDGWNASAIQDKVHDKVAAAVDKAAAALHGAKAGAKEVYYNTKKGDKKQAVVDGLAEAKAKLSPAFGAWKGKNVVLFLSDQETPLLNVPPGFEAANLPGLTRLRKNGVEFLRSYTNACMCTAARATLFTGRYNTQHNARYVLETTMPDTLYPQINTPADLINMAAAAEAAGYDVVYKGKMHLTKPANPDFTVRARGSGGGRVYVGGVEGGLVVFEKGRRGQGVWDGGSARRRERDSATARDGSAGKQDGVRVEGRAAAARRRPPARPTQRLATIQPLSLSDSPPSNLSRFPSPSLSPFPSPSTTSVDVRRRGQVRLLPLEFSRRGRQPVPVRVGRLALLQRPALHGQRGRPGGGQGRRVPVPAPSGQIGRPPPFLSGHQPGQPARRLVLPAPVQRIRLQPGPAGRGGEPAINLR